MIERRIVRKVKVCSAILTRFCIFCDIIGPKPRYQMSVYSTIDPLVLNEAILTCTKNLCLIKNKKNITLFICKLSRFYSFKNALFSINLLM